MTLIAFQDGKPILTDGKVGTEQACCCVEGEEPCSCGFVLPEGCEVDYIAVTLEFRFNNCGNGLATQEFILNDENDFGLWVDPLLDENGNVFQANVSLQCSGGQYRISWIVIATGQTCFYICDESQGFIAGLARGFPIITQTYKGFCCPVAIDSYEWDGEDGLCPGAYIAVTDITIVLV